MHRASTPVDFIEEMAQKRLKYEIIIAEQANVLRSDPPRFQAAMANVQQSPLVAKKGQPWQPTQDKIDEFLAHCDEMCDLVPQDFDDRVKIMHGAYGALMCLVSCKLVRHRESTQLAILKRFHELSTSIPPIQDDHANNVATVQKSKEMERSDSETTNDLPFTSALTTPVDHVVSDIYQAVHEALAKDMDGLVMDSYFGLEAGDKNLGIVQPRRITSEELRLFQNPENLLGKQFVLSDKDDPGKFEVIGYSRKRDRSVEYDVLYDDCGDSSIRVNAKEMMALLKDSLYLPA